MYVTRRTLGQIDGSTTGMTVWDWSFTLGLFLFGGWLMAEHWKR